MLMPTGGENSNIFNTLLASAGGAIIVYIITRIFSKTEDSASKEYVDTKCDKLDDKIAAKVDRVDFNNAIQRLESKQDMIISLLLEQRQQSTKK